MLLDYPEYEELRKKSNILGLFLAYWRHRLLSESNLYDHFTTGYNPYYGYSIHQPKI